PHQHFVSFYFCNSSQNSALCSKRRSLRKRHCLAGDLLSPPPSVDYASSSHLLQPLRPFNRQLISLRRPLEASCKYELYGGGGGGGEFVPYPIFLFSPTNHRNLYPLPYFHKICKSKQLHPTMATTTDVGVACTPFFVLLKPSTADSDLVH
ncbi:hypothetical protein LINPERHAP1_LOCUS8401, partial [Linum perenne]